jgi:hypothetical protein
MDKEVLEESYTKNAAVKHIADYEKRTGKKFKFAEYAPYVEEYLTTRQ